MPHLFLDVFRILTLIDQKACKSVSEVVKSDFLDFCLFKANDIAILKVQELKNLPKPLVIAKTTAVAGTKVFTIGYSFLELGEKPKLTEGIINSVYGIGDDPRLY